jgi:hypothetical protein
LGSSLVGPLFRDQLPMLTKNGVGCDKRSNIDECSSTDGLAANRESATRICQGCRTTVMLEL